jgi:hypothetical protein
MASTCTLLSLDVEAMYPSIPVDRACEHILGLLEVHQDRLKTVSYLTPYQVVHFLKLSIHNTVAVVNAQGRERFYVQRQGLAMGKAFSPLVADLFMGSWEKDLEHIARENNVNVIAACRYMDDYLILCRGGVAELKEWIACLNRKDPSIKVSHELENDCQLPFLDLLIRRQSSGFVTSVYRKSCNTAHAVPFHSYTDIRF